jgi:hypothetical protein
MNVITGILSDVDALSLAIENLTSPPVLAFVLGALAVVVRSDLRLPDPIHTWLSAYLLLAIGLKGGSALRDVDPVDLVGPATATVAIGLVTPLVTYGAGRRLLALSRDDSGTLAAHFGSVSVVTFTAASVFVTEAGFGVEGFMTSLVALLEIPGIIVALMMVSLRGAGGGWTEALHEVLTGRSVLLLVGGLVIGGVASDAAFARVEPFFVDMFTGLLVLFLLDMGATAAARLRGSRSLTPRVIAFGIVAPIVFGVLGVIGGVVSGLSVGGAAVLGTMAASASYIAAPAATRLALPDADHALSLGVALGVTFPFNLALGIPLYVTIADALA